MARISKLAREEAGAEAQLIFDEFMRVRGNIPNMFRVFAHRPELLKTVVAHFTAIMQSGTVSAKLKELVILRTSQINHCQY